MKEIRRYYTELKNTWNQQDDYPAFWDVLSTWDTTLAPKYSRTNNNPGVFENINVWENYRDNIERPGLNNYRNGNAYNYAYNVSNPTGDDAGYSEYPFQDNNSIGVDCGGLIYMSGIYLNNEYNKAKEIGTGRRWYMDRNDDSDEDADESDNLYFISEFNPADEPINLKKIIPGDIFYYYKYHVGIVLDVKRSDNMTVNDIVLIESTYSNPLNQAGVIDYQTLDYYNTTNPKDWKIGRMEADE